LKLTFANNKDSPHLRS